MKEVCEIIRKWVHCWF